MSTAFPRQWLAALAISTSTVFAQAPSTPAAASSQGSGQLSAAMRSGMDSMAQMKMSGDLDKDFAMMMKMHHQQAVNMAKIEVEHGKSPEIKAMARKMMTDQKMEIDQLDAWLKKHP